MNSEKVGSTVYVYLFNNELEKQSLLSCKRVKEKNVISTHFGYMSTKLKSSFIV